MENNTELLAIINKIDRRTDFSYNIAGYAASDATKSLLANWRQSVKESSEPSCFVDDIDDVIAELTEFKSVAQKMLPIAYGGFDDKSPEYWLNKLEKQGISVYESEDSDGYYGFSDCESDSYTSKDAAISGALIYHHELMTSSPKQKMKG